jgi:hypothetical protein
MLSQEHSDRAGRDLDAELEELALDAAITLTRVLSGHLEDQGLDLLRDRWPSTVGSSLECRPLAPSQLAMPAQKRGRREHQLAGPDVAAEGGEDQPIGWQEFGPFDLAAQNGDLVPKRQNLKPQLSGRAAVEMTPTISRTIE